MQQMKSMIYSIIK